MKNKYINNIYYIYLMSQFNYVVFMPKYSDMNTVAFKINRSVNYSNCYENLKIKKFLEDNEHQYINFHITSESHFNEYFLLDHLKTRIEIIQ